MSFLASHMKRSFPLHMYFDICKVSNFAFSVHAHKYDDRIWENQKDKCFPNFQQYFAPKHHFWTARAQTQRSNVTLQLWNVIVKGKRSS